MSRSMIWHLVLATVQFLVILLLSCSVIIHVFILNIRYLERRWPEFVLNTFRLILIRIVFNWKSWLSSYVAMNRSVCCSAMQQRGHTIWISSISDSVCMFSANKLVPISIALIYFTEPIISQRCYDKSADASNSMNNIIVSSLDICKWRTWCKCDQFIFWKIEKLYRYNFTHWVNVLSL